MNKKTLIGGLVFVFSVYWAGAVLAYQIEFIYGPRASYALAHSEHAYGIDQSIEAWDFDESQGTATAAAWSPAQCPSAIAQVVASPIGAGPVATVNLQVTDRTAAYSYAYGWADTLGSFTILKEPGDSANQVPVNIVFHVTGILNLQGGAYYTYSYGFYLDGVAVHSASGYTGDPPTLNDLFITTPLLEVGLPYTFEVSLDGSLQHHIYRLNTALFQASLDVQVQHTPLPPSLLLLGSGLLSLSFLGWWRKQG